MTDPSPQAAPPSDPALTQPPQRRPPGYGEYAPPFVCASEVNPKFASRSLGGKWMVLMFFGTLGHEPSRLAHEQVLERRALFDDVRAQFFGVTYDPADRDVRGMKNIVPGVRYFWDFDRAVWNLYGLVIPGGYRPSVFLLDRNMRVAAVESISNTGRLLDQLESHLAEDEPEYGAPVLTIPRILEPEFCRALIENYEANGGTASGFMREIDGKTVPMLDDRTKKRRDFSLTDQGLIAGLRARITNRLVPAVEEVFSWRATRIERYIVACYSAEDGGFFTTHRDNTTPGTAHRRFAVTINLNDDYDGGDLRFPEFGQKTYRTPVGGATVFNCNMLHEATKVTRGTRYATVPFLYDEAGKALRDANMHSVVSAEEAGLVNLPL